MYVTLKEAAQLTGRSVRSVRYLIKQGRLPAKRKGRLWLIHKDALPLTEAQRQGLNARAEALQLAVEPLITAPAAAGLVEPPSPSKTEPRVHTNHREEAHRPIDGSGGTAAPSAGQSSRRPAWTPRKLEVFQCALDTCTSLHRLLLGADASEMRLMPEARLADGIRQLCAGCYQFDGGQKRALLREARSSFTAALADLLMLQRQLELAPALLEAPGLAVARTGATGNGIDKPTRPEALAEPIQLLEQSLLPKLGALLRSIEANGEMGRKRGQRPGGRRRT